MRLDQKFEQYLGGRTDANLPTLEDIFEDIDEAEMDVEPTPESNNPTDANEEAGEPETSEGPGKATPIKEGLSLNVEEANFTPLLPVSRYF
ncbi:unnamed protein product [Cuscuta campestris]|uniref:Uncharacterized protein n=1 Tax=Cuscuta campestris TaxID=132261 RepID=A0A484LIT8_9ASTE|nr:unnamed protein product [Cuscuta campestris]